MGPTLGWADESSQYADLYGTIRVFSRVELEGTVYYDRFSNDLAFFDNRLFAANTNISRDINDVYGTNLQAAEDLTASLRLKAGTFLKQDRQHWEGVAGASRAEQDALTTGEVGRETRRKSPIMTIST